MEDAEEKVTIASQIYDLVSILYIVHNGEPWVAYR
jgi:hypothetical protein